MQFSAVCGSLGHCLPFCSEISPIPLTLLGVAVFRGAYCSVYWFDFHCSFGLIRIFSFSLSFPPSASVNWYIASSPEAENDYSSDCAKIIVSSI